MNKTFAFEAKISKKPSLPFVAVKDHQENALYFVKHGVFYYKISDSGLGEKPFDGFFMAREDAFIVIFWYEKRGDKRFSMIAIDDWLAYKEKADRKSITYPTACKIGQCYEF